MNKISIFFLLLFAACSARDRYNPDKHLDLKEKNEFVSSIVRYAGKRPEPVKDSARFDEKFNAHYNSEQARHMLKLYFESSSGEKFFLLTRKAPSLYEKYVAIGGKLRVDENYLITEYEEVFRTWKMVQDTLDQRASLLFDKMVKGESLDPYLTKNSNGVEYIEFPDDNVYFDKESRKWKSKQFGSVEEMVNGQ
jgi:hypothetical protein